MEAIEHPVAALDRGQPAEQIPGITPTESMAMADKWILREMFGGTREFVFASFEECNQKWKDWFNTEWLKESEAGEESEWVIVQPDGSQLYALDFPFLHDHLPPDEENVVVAYPGFAAEGKSEDELDRTYFLADDVRWLGEAERLDIMDDLGTA